MLEYIEARGRREDGMDVVVFRGGAQHAFSLRYEAEGEVDPAALLSEVVTMRIGPIDGPGDDAPSGPS